MVPTWHVLSVPISGVRPNEDDMGPDNCIFTYSVS